MANDTFTEQIVANAEAAIDAVVKMGATSNVGVGGHSYGAFMAVMLLANSDLFRQVLRSGAYNRTLTPFDFRMNAARSGMPRKPIWKCHRFWRCENWLTC